MTTPWIQNISLTNIVDGRHYDAGPNSMLIQIVDPDMEFPKPKYNFKEIRQFKFLDIDENVPEAPQFSHAIDLVSLLQYALKNRMNVIVHCVAGICRSGAVKEVGVILGFLDTESYTIPNVRLKTMMMRAAGMSVVGEKQ